MAKKSDGSRKRVRLQDEALKEIGVAANAAADAVDEAVGAMKVAMEQPVVRAGKKDDAGKPMLELLPWDALVIVGQVMTQVVASGRYSRENWRNVENWRQRYLGAIQRHIADYYMGVRIDHDSGLPTLAHVACDALFLLALEHGLGSAARAGEVGPTANEQD